MPTTTPILPTRRKLYSTSSTATLMQPRTSASRILRCCINRLHESVQFSYQHRRHQPQRSGALYLGSVMFNDATVSKDLDNCCSKPEDPLEDSQREYGRVIRFASPQRSRYTEPSSFPPLLHGAETWFSTGSKSRYLSGSSTLLALHL